MLVQRGGGPIHESDSELIDPHFWHFQILLDQSIIPSSILLTFFVQIKRFISITFISRVIGPKTLSILFHKKSIIWHLYQYSPWFSIDWSPFLLLLDHLTTHFYDWVHFKITCVDPLPNIWCPLPVLVLDRSLDKKKTMPLP